MHRELKRQNEDLRLPGKLHCGQWISFIDANGKGWAQPDAFLITEKIIVLFEAKLTQTSTAALQMLGLYIPLLKFLFGKPVICCQVTKNVREIGKFKIDKPSDLLNNFGYEPRLWHFLG